MSTGYSIIQFIPLLLSTGISVTMRYMILEKVMFCKIMNLKIRVYEKNVVEAGYSKPMQLCNQCTKSTNKNTSMSSKAVLNS